MSKIKVSFGEDLRVFKTEKLNVTEVYDALRTFIAQTFGINQFILRYVDDEDDMIRIACLDDFVEAIEISKDSGKLLKIFVVRNQQPEMKFETDVMEETIIPNENNEINENNENNENNNNNNDKTQTQCFVDRLLLDENFRYDVVAFLQDIILSLRDGDNFEVAVQTALATHESLQQCNEFSNILPFLPLIGQHISLILPIITSIEPNMVSQLMETFINAIKSNDSTNLPPYMQMLFARLRNSQQQQQQQHGEMPCGRGKHNRGHRFRGRWGDCGWRRGRGRHGRGRRCGNGNGNGRGNGNGNGNGNGHGCGRGRHGGYGYGRKYCNNNFPTYQVTVIAEDVTLADKAYVLPKHTVIKTWRIQNTGENAWPEGVKIEYVGRRFNPIVNGVSFNVPTLQPGQEGECSVVLDTPQEDGRYGCTWRLKTADGYVFGPLLRARVVVVTDSEGKTNKKEVKHLNKLKRQQQNLQDKLAKLDEKITMAKNKNSEEKISENMEEQNSNTEELEQNNNQLEESVSQVFPLQNEEISYQEQMKTLILMGFNDVQLNRALLNQHQGCLDVVLNSLCELKV